MRLEPLVVIIKAGCLTWIPIGSAMAAGIPLLKIPVIFGIQSELLTLLFSASVAGVSGLYGFLSNSFGNYMKTRNGNGNGEPPKPS